MQAIHTGKVMPRLRGTAKIIQAYSATSPAARHNFRVLASARIGFKTTSRPYSSSTNETSPFKPKASWAIWLFGVASGAFLNYQLHKSSPSTANEIIETKSSSNVPQDPITAQLNTESSVHNEGGSPVTSYHVTRLEASSPCEDRYVHGKLSGSEGSVLQAPWHAWAVFDGHAGSQTAALLTKRLLPAVQDALHSLALDRADDGAVSETIQNAFVALDKDIVQGAVEAVKAGVAYHEQVAKIMPAYTGSCALLSLLDPKTWTLRVACVGDSRAVLGEQDANGTWKATALSVDQTGSNEDETARINAEHPGESGIVKDGRVLGLMVSRGFGDGRWKWDLDFQKEIKTKFELGFNPLSPAKYAVETPPYLTAEPVVTTTKLDRKRPSFLILASDGFWDRVSTKQAVDLIGGWLNSRESAERQPLGRDTKSSSPAAVVEEKSRGPFSLDKYGWDKPGFRFSRDREAFQDKDNAAVHLLRNALGGNYTEMVEAYLVAEPPFARCARDDITVQVVFFDPSKLQHTT
ncbi:hypothetical protein G7054_g365 [Neopestalotiopsis clavispora]|nr:hypothetical protein G7054_g365 [Neopestalotiopsis clavispora]